MSNDTRPQARRILPRLPVVLLALTLGILTTAATVVICPLLSLVRRPVWIAMLLSEGIKNSSWFWSAPQNPAARPGMSRGTVSSSGVRYPGYSLEYASVDWISAQNRNSFASFTTTTQYRVNAGFPFTAVGSRREATAMGFPTSRSGLPTPTRPIQFHPQHRILTVYVTRGIFAYIPLQQITRGALADVAIWSATWMLVFFAAGRIRSWARRKRGRCSACSYPTTGLANCPECGKPVYRTQSRPNGDGVSATIT
jgi:hypothetical protein